MKSPIAARVEAVAGRRLQPDWQKNLGNTGCTYDRRDVENMWHTPNWSNKGGQATSENLIQNARLSP